MLLKMGDRITHRVTVSLTGLQDGGQLWAEVGMDLGGQRAAKGRAGTT